MNSKSLSCKSKIISLLHSATKVKNWLYFRSGCVCFIWNSLHEKGVTVTFHLVAKFRPRLVLVVCCDYVPFINECTQERITMALKFSVQRVHTRDVMLKYRVEKWIAMARHLVRNLGRYILVVSNCLKLCSFHGNHEEGVVVSTKFAEIRYVITLVILVVRLLLFIL